MPDMTLETAHKHLAALRTEIGKVVVGQKHLVDRLIMAVLVKGHLLLEGVPGLAKTTTIIAFGRACKADFQRIQFTPDLLPSDVVGSQVFSPKTQDFWVKKGPVFAHLVLADEINRAPAKVQSALLEAMQERQVTIGEETFDLPNPFLVLSTQNPIEQEGTFPLPEAQVDRFFMKVILDYPTQEEELEIMDRVETQDFNAINPVLSLAQLRALPTVLSQVFMDEKIKRYVSDIIFATRYPDRYDLGDLKDQIAFGASPRGSLYLISASRAQALLEGRDYVIPDDVKAVAKDVLRHRVTPSFEAEAEDIDSEALVDRILDTLIVP